MAEKKEPKIIWTKETEELDEKSFEASIRESKKNPENSDKKSGYGYGYNESRGLFDSSVIFDKRESDRVSAIEEAKKKEIRKKISEMPQKTTGSGESIPGREQKKPVSKVASYLEAEISEKKVGRRGFFSAFLGDIEKNFKEGKKEKTSKKPESFLDGLIYSLKPKEYTRREILKKTPWAVLTSYFAFKYYGIDSLIKGLFSGKEVDQENDEDAVQKQIEETELEASPYEFEKEKNDENASRDILRYRDEGEIKYGREQFEDQIRHWYARYSNNEDLKPMIRQSYGRVMSWMEAEIEGERNMKQIFEEEFIQKLGERIGREVSESEKKELYMMYIAQVIRESGGGPREISPAGAVGMHQFMKGTVEGEKLGLKIYGNIDERFDPIKSAEAYAKFMLKLYERYDRKMDLARIGYNGVMGGYYKQACAERGEKPRMEMDEFFDFVQSDLNKTLKEVRSSNEKNKEVIFRKKIKKYTENTNYLPAIIAIRTVLHEMEEERGFPEAETRIVANDHVKVQKIGKNVKIKIGKGDTAYGIAKKYGMSEEKLAAMNGLKKDKKGNYIVKKGHEIFISKVSNPTLMDYAGGSKERFDKLCFLNPKIKNPEMPIPAGTIIRI